MNAGECTTPCGVSKRAARAAPLVDSMVNSKLTRAPRSYDRHRVAVRVEAITLGDRLIVGAHREVVSGERRDEHDQRGAGKVEVGHERIHRTQPSGWTDEDTRLSVAGAHVAFLVRGAL